MAPQRDVDGNLMLDVDGDPVLASADPRWVGSRRVVVDNKGKPVRQYEPYFSSTHAYEAEAELREQGVTPVMHYDPLGRMERTLWPDGNETRVEFSPWHERRFDRNDTVLGTPWHTERMALPAGDPERRAAVLSEAHADTPATAHLDALGRPFLQVDHNRDELGADVFAVTRLLLDVVGNVLQVIDARGNLAEAREHGLLRQALRVTSEDAGERRVLRHVLGSPHRAWNNRGFVTTVEYDAAQRSLSTVVTRPDTSTFTAVRMVYGESVPDPETSNLRGRAFRVYDGAGVMQSNAFDFAGNLLSQSRQLTVAYVTTPSWTALDGLTTIADLDTAAAPLLEAETFTTAATFDALGRPVTQNTPDASEIQLAYDDGGKLLTVAANVRAAVTPTDFVTSIEYDARGQRQRIDYGNGTRTDYEHDPLTFRLRRLHTINTAGTVVHQDLRYAYDPVGNITEIRDLAQPIVFTSNAAISADQRFVYDALYRLIEAEGREHGSQGQPLADDFTSRAAPDDPTGLRAYVENYAYDLVGNILQLQHQAPGGNWTRHYDYAAAGNRLLATSAPGDGPGVFSHTYQYNTHGSMTAMPHLAQVDWDHADRMQSADLGGGGTVWFLYDSAGNRVRKIRVNQAGTSTNERIYLGGYEVYREHVGTELRLERETLHIADDSGRICLVETKTIDDADVVPLPANISRYQYGNHLGSVGMELDETGQLISYEEFHPYGTTAYRAANSAVDVSPSRYRYTGQERDEETGLGHHGARYYASWLGRWTAADPIGLGDGPNRYRYARNRPSSLHDPNGMLPPDGPSVDRLLYRNHPELHSQLEQAHVPNPPARVTGVFSAIAGSVEMAAGAIITVGSDGFGVAVGGALLLHGYDTSSAGTEQAITGKPTRTRTSRAGAAIVEATTDLSPRQAEAAGELFDLGVGVGLAIASTRVPLPNAPRTRTTVKPSTRGSARTRQTTAQEVPDAASAPKESTLPEGTGISLEAPFSTKGEEWSVPEVVKAKVPAGWGPGVPNKKKVGMRWQRPGSRGGDSVRIDQGDPASPFPSQRVDHVRVNSGGKVIGPDGEPITRVPSPKDTAEAHIPLSEWLKWKNWNSP